MRVVDASVIPLTIGVAIMPTVYAIAEKVRVPNEFLRIVQRLNNVLQASDMIMKELEVGWPASAHASGRDEL